MSLGGHRTTLLSNGLGHTAAREERWTTIADQYTPPLLAPLFANQVLQGIAPAPHYESSIVLSNEDRKDQGQKAQNPPAP